jgi:AraC-like DNA-binding protein
MYIIGIQVAGLHLMQELDVNSVLPAPVLENLPLLAVIYRHSCDGMCRRLNSTCHVVTVYGPGMEVAELAHLRRARDLLDREYARPLDVPTMARAALMSPSLFSRRFRETYGDTPYGYLQARRVERAMALLRYGHMSVTDVCMAVGFTSLGSFSSTFTRLVGEPPSVYKARDHSRLTRVPPCMTRAWARPRWVAQPCRIGEAFLADRT